MSRYLFYLILDPDDITEGIHPRMLILDDNEKELGLQLQCRIYNENQVFFTSRNLGDTDLVLYAPNDLRKDPEFNRLSRARERMGGSKLDLCKWIPSDFGASELDGDLIHLVVEAHRPAQRSASPSLLPLSPSDPLHQFGGQVTFPLFLMSSSFKPAWNAVVDEMGMVDADDPPPLVRVVVEQPRRVAKGEEDSANKCMNSFREALDARTPGNGQIINELLSDASIACPYATEHPEIFHYFHGFRCTLSKRVLWKPGTSDLTMDRARYIVFDNFWVYWLRQVEGAQYKFNKRFPFPLIARYDEHGKTLSSKYWPQPDFFLLKHGLPRFMVEFDSHDNSQDKYCLLVQMACVLRLSHALLYEDGIDAKDFFLMGASFTKQWEIFRYLFYVEKGKVCYHERMFKMCKVSDLMTFLFEFYNYVHHVQDEGILGDKEQVIQNLSEEIDRRHTKCLNTGKRGTKRSHSKAGQGEEGLGSKEGSNKYAAMANALQTWNYMLPDHVLEAKAPDGQGVIAKLSGKHSDELSLLRELSSQTSCHNHVIPLLDTVQSNLGPIIILPQATLLSTSMSSYLFHRGLKGKLVQLSRELIEGIAFLHRRKVAHLDIKPENLVYSFRSKRLFIIDFDIAIRCKDADETVEMSCGTRGWSAPEIAFDDDEPLRAFNPIRADLWSCGKVLRFFAEVADEDEKDGDIILLMDLLMDNDPRSRPLLYEMVDEEPHFWTSGRLLQALESQFCGGRVQKAMLEQGTYTKRTRDDTNHAGKEALASKIPRRESSLDSLCPFSTSNSIHRADRSPSGHGKVNGGVEETDSCLMHD